MTYPHPVPRVTSLFRRVCLGITSAMVVILLMGSASWMMIKSDRFIPHGLPTSQSASPMMQSIATTQPVIWIVLHMDTRASDARGWAAWKKDADAKFPGGYVLVLGHGGDIFGQWCVFPTIDALNPVRPYAPIPVPVEFFAECLRHDFPSLPIIFITCNPDHAVIHVTNVYYSPDYIWITPDDADGLGERFMRRVFDSNVVGDFAHMVHTPGGTR